MPSGRFKIYNIGDVPQLVKALGSRRLLERFSDFVEECAKEYDRKLFALLSC